MKKNINIKFSYNDQRMKHLTGYKILFLFILVFQKN